MRLVIPVAAVPSQRLNVTLEGQSVGIVLRSFNDRQYVTLLVNGETVFSNTLVVDRTPLKKYSYLPFVGDIASVDTQGTSDPDWKGWGSRFVLVYDSDGFK